MKTTQQKEVWRMLSYYGLNRTYCDVCNEMRSLIDHGTQNSWKSNKEVLRSLVEELQVYGNRMEASLADVNDIKALHDDISKLKTELRALKAQKKKLKPEDEDA